MIHLGRDVYIQADQIVVVAPVDLAGRLFMAGTPPPAPEGAKSWVMLPDRSLIAAYETAVTIVERLRKWQEYQERLASIR